MFRLFKRDPIKKLEAERLALLERARDLQRGGDIVAFAEMMQGMQGTDPAKFAVVNGGLNPERQQNARELMDHAVVRVAEIAKETEEEEKKKAEKAAKAAARHA